MRLLKGKHISLRALEPEDLEFLYQIENNETFWEVSHTVAPFSKYVLKKYLENANLDLFQARQLRLIIEKKQTQDQIGLIDLFDYDPQHRRAGIGILIHPDFQQKGFASESLSIIIKYAFTLLNLHQLYANVTSDNRNSITLFSRNNFKKIGVKKDWIFSKGSFKDEILFQLIKD